MGSIPTEGSTCIHSWVLDTLSLVRKHLPSKEKHVHGPVWNNPNVGVTGEPKFRTQEPNYVTTTDAEGNTVTLTGEAADAYRATHGI